MALAEDHDCASEKISSLLDYSNDRFQQNGEVQAKTIKERLFSMSTNVGVASSRKPGDKIVSREISDSKADLRDINSVLASLEIEDMVRLKVEEIVSSKIQETIRSQIEEMVRLQIEGTVHSKVEETIRLKIEEMYSKINDIETDVEKYKESSTERADSIEMLVESQQQSLDGLSTKHLARRIMHQMQKLYPPHPGNLQNEVNVIGEKQSITEQTLTVVWSEFSKFKTRIDYLINSMGSFQMGFLKKVDRRMEHSNKTMEERMLSHLQTLYDESKKVVNGHTGALQDIRDEFAALQASSTVFVSTVENNLKAAEKRLQNVQNQTIRKISSFQGAISTLNISPSIKTETSERLSHCLSASTSEVRPGAENSEPGSTFEAYSTKEEINSPVKPTTPGKKRKKNVYRGESTDHSYYYNSDEDEPPVRRLRTSRDPTLS